MDLLPMKRRSALQFALDVTGGSEIVYLAAVYLLDIINKLEAAPGLQDRARIDLFIFDGSYTTITSPQMLLSDTQTAANRPHITGASLYPLLRAIALQEYEGGGFHTFLILTRDLAPEWSNIITSFHDYVGSVSVLCCGSFASPHIIPTLSKNPGGTRVVDPLSTIRVQFDSVAQWLIGNFANPVPARVYPSYTQHQIQHTYSQESGQQQLQPSTLADSSPKPQQAAWRVIEPTDHNNPFPHTQSEYLLTNNGWFICGASRRGKLHAHEGRYRDDAFALGLSANWILAAVADGAGSCRLSRVGAHHSTTQAIGAMEKIALTFDGEIDEIEQAQILIRTGMQAAYQSVYAEAERRQIPVRDLSATLLLAAFRSIEETRSSIVVTAQVGDGMIVAGDDRAFRLLGEADVGFYSGETRFLPSTGPEQWDERIHIDIAQGYPAMIVLMTDGIADDMFPPQKHLPMLLTALHPLQSSSTPAEDLLETISYDKRDSADDRTLVAITRQQK